MSATDPSADTPRPESSAQGPSSTPFMNSMGASGVLGLTLVANEDGRVRMRIGYRDELSRSAAQPALHPGPIITAIDSAMGMTGMQFMERLTGAPSGIATLDFRYDEFSAPADRSDVLIEAFCERLDGDILYITGACLCAEGSTVHGRATGRFIRTPSSNMPTSMSPLASLAAAMRGNEGG